MINPKTQEFMASRMGAKIRSSRVDHSPMYSATDLVVDVILEAARESHSLMALQTSDGEHDCQTAASKPAEASENR